MWDLRIVQLEASLKSFISWPYEALLKGLKGTSVHISQVLYSSPFSGIFPYNLYCVSRPKLQSQASQLSEASMLCLDFPEFSPKTASR